MKAPSGDLLPARGAAKVTQMVVLNNPNKVSLTNKSSEQCSVWTKLKFPLRSVFTLLFLPLLPQTCCLDSLMRGWYHPLNPSSSSLQVNLKMRVRLSYTRQGSAFQDTIQIDSFPGLGGAGHWQRPRCLSICRRAHRLRLSLTDDSHTLHYIPDSCLSNVWPCCLVADGGNQPHTRTRITPSLPPPTTTTLTCNWWCKLLQYDVVMLKYEVCSAITTITLYHSCFRTSDADIDCSLQNDYLLTWLLSVSMSHWIRLCTTLLLLKVPYYAKFKILCL